jgi:hypothetical protein
MTQTHYDDIGLGAVVERSRWIFTVRKAEPFKRYVPVPIHEDTARYKPYQRTFLRFEVTGVLLGPGTDWVGRTIEAAHWNTDTDLHCYRLYEVEKIGKSPIYERYETTADLHRLKQLILFLSWKQGDEFRYITYESMSKKKEVLREIGRIRKDTRTIYPSHDAGDLPDGVPPLP